jgi:hypothetical protein
MNKQPGKNGENAALLEASYRLNKLALFGKYEYVEKSSEELALDETIYGDVLFPVHAFTFGLNYDVFQFNKTRMAVAVILHYIMTMTGCIACMVKILQRLKYMFESTLP